MNKTLFPSEIKVWYIIPAIRKELAKILVNKKGISQRKTAELLGLTEAAVSQYLKDKRANEVKLTIAIKKKILAVADRIIEKEEKSSEELINLVNTEIVTKLICEFHKTHDERIKKNCDICFKKKVVL